MMTFAYAGERARLQLRLFGHGFLGQPANNNTSRTTKNPSAVNAIVKNDWGIVQPSLYSTVRAFELKTFLDTLVA